MNKKAFTLAELLITICIIGLLASILMPQLTRLRPNKDKMLTMKYYNAVSETIEYLLSNPAIYADNSDGNDCFGLACTTAPSIEALNGCSGNNKLQCLLMSELDINGGNQNPFTIAPGVTCNVGAIADGFTTITLTIDAHTHTYQIDKFGRFQDNSNSDALMRAYLQNPTKLNTWKEDSELAAEITKQDKEDEEKEQDEEQE